MLVILANYWKMAVLLRTNFLSCQDISCKEIKKEEEEEKERREGGNQVSLGLPAGAPQLLPHKEGQSG